MLIKTGPEFKYFQWKDKCVKIGPELQCLEDKKDEIKKKQFHCLKG